MTNKDKTQLKKALQLVMTLQPTIQALTDIAREREMIGEIIKKIEPLLEPLEELADDEQAKYDDKSHKWQQTYRGEQQYELADNLQRAFSALDEAKDHLTYCLRQD